MVVRRDPIAPNPAVHQSVSAPALPAPRLAAKTKGGTRAEEKNSPLRPSRLDAKVLKAANALGKIAEARGQSMVQLALSWVLRRKEMTSALIGVRTLEQLKDNLGTLKKLKLGEDEIASIDKATTGALLDLHPKPSGWLR